MGLEFGRSCVRFLASPPFHNNGRLLENFRKNSIVIKIRALANSSDKNMLKDNKIRELATSSDMSKDKEIREQATSYDKYMPKDEEIREIATSSDMSKDMEIPALTTSPDKDMSKDNKGSKTKAVLKEVGWFAVKTTVISGAVLGGVALAVPALGFTAGGVAAGSVAAAYQSAALGGTIASGSAFAVLQSVGAVGLAASTQAAVVAASAATAGAHTFLKKLKFKKKEQEADTCNCEKEKKVCSCTKNSKVACNNFTSSEDENDNSDDGIRIVMRGDGSVKAIVSKENPKNNDKELKREISNENKDMLNETSPESIEKWKDVQLTDDVTITKDILKRKKI